MIKNIQFNDFRLFNKEKMNTKENHHIMNLGKNITVISGRNASGKSNLLGMLGNSVQHKGITPNNTALIRNPHTTAFTTPFDEIFKGSLDFDPTGPRKFKIEYTDDFESITDYRDFRVAWQNDNTRFRVIPKKVFEDGTSTEAKVDWPVLYLGLSRLYPLGEVDDSNLKESELKLKDDERQWFFNNYSDILNLDRNELQSFSSIDFKNVANKKSIGVNASYYDYLTNSAGQDNIGQILISVLSFKRLKTHPDSSDNYTGGLLLIDELDATLHPISQNRLFDFLLKESKDLKIQVVFTTHSLSLLKYITNKTYYNTNTKDFNNAIELYYLNKNQDMMEVFRNENYEFISNELMLTSALYTRRKIKIYTEDDEAKWLLEGLICKHLGRFNIISMGLGSKNLLKFNHCDPEYFSGVLFVLDGDVSDEDINGALLKKQVFPQNIIKLPGDYSPEKFIYNYLKSLSHDHEIFSELRRSNITMNYIIHNGPCSETYKKYEKERDKYKNWFIDNKQVFDMADIISHWINDNKDSYDNFMDKFISVSNALLKQLRLPLLD